MSLTSHLKNPQSPVRQFLHEQFPNVTVVVQQAGNKLEGISTLRPTAKLPYTTIGMALDYRLRYYFAITPHRDLVAWHGANRLCGRPGVSEKGIEVAVLIPNELGEPVISQDLVDSFFSHLDNFLGNTTPVRRKLEQPPEEMLARHCVILALFEEAARAPIRSLRNSPLFAKEYKEPEDLLAIAELHWVHDLSELSWLFYEQFNELLALPAVLNPTFEGSPDVGGADADFIVDGYLNELKTTVNPRVDREWLYQLLGYVLLDYNDHYRLRGVGLYLSRQGVHLQWQMTDFLTAIAGDASAKLPELRDRLRHLLQLPESRQQEQP